jgi:4'-phosphopantetheinyl transferase EntD
MPDLLAALRRALPPGAGVGQADARADHPLWPGEGVAGATPARLREFAAGRAAFRVACADAGLPGVALPMAADRSPVWPPGLALSITHDGADALAAVLTGARGVGIDLEPDTPLPADVAEVALTPADTAESRLVFSAKEAAYKALFPVMRQVIGFDAMAIAVQGPALTARLLHACGPFPAGFTLTGGYARSEGRIVTAFVLG